MPADEIEETLHLSEINDRPWNIQACSAQNGEGKYFKFYPIRGLFEINIKFETTYSQLNTILSFVSGL